MADVVPLVLLGALALQIPIGILMYVDAKRLGLKNPELYWLGVVVPTAGFVVILYYFSERRNLPRKDTEGTGDESTR